MRISDWSSDVCSSDLALDDIQVLATMKFLRACEDDRGNFNASRAETTLRDAWVTEKMLLQDGRDYWISLEGRGFDGEINPTERSWLDYDSFSSEENTSALQSLMRIS